jgi:hypothetical protein
VQVPEDRRTKAGLPFGLGILDHENVSTLEFRDDAG